MELMIRHPRPGDMDALLLLWNQELGCPVTAEGLASALARMAEDPAYETWVAQVDGVVAGMVTTVRVLAVGMPQGYLKINGLAVAGPFRRQGVASALMDHVETLARQAGLGCVLLNSGVRREDAHAFYQSRGYCRDSWCFDKTL